MATLPPGTFVVDPLLIIPEADELTRVGAVIQFDPPLFTDVEFSVTVQRPTLTQLTTEQYLLVPGVVLVFSDDSSVTIDEATTSITAPAGTTSIKILSRQHLVSTLGVQSNSETINTAELLADTTTSLPRSDGSTRPYPGGPFSTSDIVTLSLPLGHDIIPDFGERVYHIAVDRSYYGKASFAVLRQYLYDYVAILDYGLELKWDNPEKIRSTAPDSESPDLSLYTLELLDCLGRPVSQGLGEMALANLDLPASQQKASMLSLPPTSNLNIQFRSFANEDLTTQTSYDSVLNKDSCRFYPGSRFIKMRFSKQLPMDYIKGLVQSKFDEDPTVTDGITLVDVFKLRISRSTNAMQRTTPDTGLDYYKEYTLMITMRYQFS